MVDSLHLKANGWLRPMPMQRALMRIALIRQFRNWKWFWVVLAGGQLLFAVIIVAAFSRLFPRVNGRGGTFAYAMAVYAGIVAWSLVQDGALQAANLFRENRSYLIRFRVPLWSYAVAAVGVRALVMLCGVLILLVGELLLGQGASWRWLLLLPVMPALLALSLGFAWLSSVICALEPRIQQLLPQLFLFWFFATPIVYPRSALPDGLRVLSAYNPMTHVVECFQWIVVPVAPVSSWSWLIGGAFTAVVFAAGAWMTRRSTRAVMDAL